MAANCPKGDAAVPGDREGYPLICRGQLLPAATPAPAQLPWASPVVVRGFATSKGRLADWDILDHRHPHNIFFSLTAQIFSQIKDLSHITISREQCAAVGSRSGESWGPIHFSECWSNARGRNTPQFCKMSKEKPKALRKITHLSLYCSIFPLFKSLYHLFPMHTSYVLSQLK